MDFQTKRAIDTLVGQLTDLQDRVDRAERAAGTSQLPNSSLTGGAIRVIHEDGTARGSIGWQPDGTVAVVATNGPPPPAASAPVVVAGQLSLSITWDGLFAEGDDGDPETQPKDFDHVQVHLGTAPGFEPDAGTLRGTLAKPGGLVVSPLSDSTTYYAVLVSVNTSSVPGDPSVEVSGVPEAVVASDILDGIVTTLKLADDAVTQAKIAAAAVGTTEISDNAITTPKVVAGAIQTAQIDAGAVNAGNIAAGAVTTAKLDALAVTAANIAANAITAGKIAAGAVTASKLEATMVVATVLQSTGYVAGSSGWKVDGAGTAEFNSASFRGEVLIGPSGGPQTHIYSASGSGRIESLSNDAIENDPSRIISGTVGAGTTKQIQTNYYGARSRSTGDRPVIAQISETASGGAPPYTQIGVITSGGSFSAAVTAYKFGAVLSGNDADTFLMTQQPTSTGDLTWHIFGNAAGSNGSWARPLPVSMVCPPSESVAFDLYFRGINTASTTSTIALSVQVKVGSTVIWQPDNADTDSCACYAMPGQTAKPTAAARVFRTLIIGADKLGGYGGQTLSITPMYRASSGVGVTDWSFSAASFTMRALPEQHLSNVFS